MSYGYGLMCVAGGAFIAAASNLPREVVAIIAACFFVLAIVITAFEAAA